MLMRTNVIILLNRVPERDCLIVNAFSMGAFLRHNSNPNPNRNRNRNRNHNPNRNPNANRNPNSNSNPNPIQNALVFILFCVARKKSENRALGHDS